MLLKKSRFVSQLPETQAAFAAALLDSASAIPAAFEDSDGRGGEDRFAVYRNNVLIGLIGALGDAYPVVRRLVGDEFFRGMAALFVPGHPPHSPVMLDYGQRFPEFIATFPPAAGLPYLADVARIERAWVEAYHAPEGVVIGLDAIAAVEPYMFSRLCLTPHPSIRLVRSSLPAFSIWKVNFEQSRPGPFELSPEGECALIIRPRAEVEARCIPAGSAELLDALVQGRSMGDAAEGVFSVDPEFDLAAQLAALFRLGAFSGWHMTSDTGARM